MHAVEYVVEYLQFIHYPKYMKEIIYSQKSFCPFLKFQAISPTTATTANPSTPLPLSDITLGDELKSKKYLR